MRGYWIGLLALTWGCSSENGLYRGLDPKRHDEDKPKEEPVPEGSATLKGTICTPDGGNAVTHATVTVLHDGEPSSTETDAEGDFVLEDLPPGTWTVRVEKGSFQVEFEVTLQEGEVTELDVDECVPLEQGETKIAVITGAYDAIQDLLDELDLEYDRIPGLSGTEYVDFLRDVDAMSDYDIIFFNCGMGDAWMQHEDEVGDNLREYVRNGGSIYASDWAYWLIEVGWPGEHDFHGTENNPRGALVGASQELDAQVLDPAMAAALGSDTAHLNYDLDSWAAMEDADAEILIRADYKWWAGFGKESQEGPLATRIRDGEGTALYTTFHNEQQTTQDMLVLLEEIILSL
jgi:hypothetical protein